MQGNNPHSKRGKVVQSKYDSLNQKLGGALANSQFDSLASASAKSPGSKKGTLKKSLTSSQPKQQENSKAIPTDNSVQMS